MTETRDIVERWKQRAINCRATQNEFFADDCDEVVSEISSLRSDRDALLAALKTARVQLANLGGDVAFSDYCDKTQYAVLKLVDAALTAASERGVGK
jgi:hypothetical protein